MESDSCESAHGHAQDRHECRARHRRHPSDDRQRRKKGHHDRDDDGVAASGCQRCGDSDDGRDRGPGRRALHLAGPDPGDQHHHDRREQHEEQRGTYQDEPPLDRHLRCLLIRIGSCVVGQVSLRAGHIASLEVGGGVNRSSRRDRMHSTTRAYGYCEQRFRPWVPRDRGPCHAGGGARQSFRGSCTEIRCDSCPCRSSAAAGRLADSAGSTNRRREMIRP